MKLGKYWETEEKDLTFCYVIASALPNFEISVTILEIKGEDKVISKKSTVSGRGI